MVLSIGRLGCHENRGVPSSEKSILDVRAGEIVGIAGIDGNGQLNSFKPLLVFVRLSLVALELKGKSIVGMHPRQITELSVGPRSEDRHRDGLILR